MTGYDFAGQNILVTGGASGMGEAFARAFAQAGGNVVVADVNRERVEEVAAQLRKAGHSASAICFDATEVDSVQQLADQLKERVPQILVNSVGVGAKAREEEDQWSLYQRIIDINLNGIYRCCAAVGGLMAEHGGGSIINIASMSATIVPEKTRPGKLGEYGLMAYCASKGGVRQLTRSIAVLWAEYGIRANSVSPGYVDTPLTSEPHSNPDIRATLERKIPLRKIASTQDIADTILFLASPGSAYITGQDIVIDGGFTSL